MSGRENLKSNLQTNGAEICKGYDNSVAVIHVSKG